jgi:hypothetical protein
MRIKFEAVDKNDKLHKRASVSHVYSHCVVIHFAAHPPSKFWPKGVAACSHAEWARSRALAERNASRWRKEPDVEAIEILEARQV